MGSPPPESTTSSIVGTWLDEEAHNAPLALRWNGTKWRRTHPATVGDGGTSLADVTVTAAGRVWAVGSATGAGGEPHAVVERWRRGEWIVVATPDQPGGSSLASIAAGPAGLWAVGMHRPSDDSAHTLTERWRPGRDEWRIVASPNAPGDNQLLAVDQSPDGELWTAGFRQTEDLTRTLALHRCG